MNADLRLHGDFCDGSIEISSTGTTHFYLKTYINNLNKNNNFVKKIFLEILYREFSKQFDIYYPSNISHLKFIPQSN